MRSENSVVIGNAALTICESLLLALLEDEILDEETVKELLEDASDSHNYAAREPATSSDRDLIAAAIDRFSATILTVHQKRSGTGRKSLNLGFSIADRQGRELHTMNDNIYSVTELVGSSTKSIEDAINQAVARAAKTIRNLDWFETKEIRGHIKDDKVAHYQVVIKIGFRYED